MTTDPNPTTSPIAVVGATGQQGGAVVAALLAAGASVRALVRDPDSDSAKALAGDRVEIVRADQDDPDSLVAAFTGVQKAFLMTTFTGAGGTEGEVEHGVALGDAAQQAGVAELVYSSVGGAERGTGIPHFESKWRVEQHLATLDLRTTGVRPVLFMDNFASFAKPTVDDGTVVVRFPLPDGIPLQLVSARDIGRVCAVALLDPDRIPGGAVEIAGDELTGGQIAAAFGDDQDLPARYEELPLDSLNDDDQEKMFAWFTHLPAYRADFALTRELDPDVQDLRAWIAAR